MADGERYGVPSALSAFRQPGYGWVWLAGSCNGFANIVTTITVGWLALDLTGSALGVGLALASRAVPRLFLAAPIGAVSDYYDRRRMLQAANLFGATLAMSAAAAAFAGWLTFPVLLVVAVLEGTFDVAETTVKKAYLCDVVGKRDLVNGMTWEEMGNKLAGIVGAMVAGMALARFGAAGPFLFMAAGFVAGAAVLQRAPASAAAPRPAHRRLGVVARGLALLARNRALLLIVVVTMTAEVLLFSSEVLLPSFARDVLLVDEVGLGTMSSVRNIGSVVGLLLLAGLSRWLRPGPLLLWTTGLFGVALLAFSMSSSYPGSLAILFLVGMVFASVDALQPALVQQKVADEERGAAIGVWNLARGLAPLGNLEIGALATTLGTPMAQSLNATAALAVIVVAAMLQRRPEYNLATDGPAGDPVAD